MGHHHHHSSQSSTFRLFLTMVLNFGITAVELVGGLFTGSLSLLSDALHNFSDGIAIIISYIAIKLNDSSRTEKHTFGLKRAEILAAVINASVLIAISIYLLIESWERFQNQTPILGLTMTWVAAIGLTANLLGVWLLKRDSEKSINLKSAYLHLLSDAVSSVGVIIGGLAIHFWQLYWIDPLLTVAISLYVCKESISIVMDAIHILMMGAPDSVSLPLIKDELEKVTGVLNIHHAHIWMLNENNIHFEAHVEVDNILVGDCTEIQAHINEKLRQLYPITHTTLQFECGECETKAII